ncbi:MAG: MBL fold metallo-hydrolase [bacterium]
MQPKALNKTFNILLALLVLVLLFLVFQPKPATKDGAGAAVPVAEESASVADDGREDKPAKADEATVDMSLVPLSKDIYYVQGVAGAATFNQGFISNAGVIITDEGVVLFDALGTPALARKLLGLIREKTDKPIKYVVVSHYHADHIYGLQVYKDQGATIIGPEGAAAYLNADNAEERLAERRVSLFPWVDENTHLVPPDLTVSSTYDFKLGGKDFQIQHMGAIHSEGDMMLTVLPENILFTGDLIFEGRIPFVGDADTKAWLVTLARLAKSHPTALVPGHGPAAKDPVHALKFTQGYLAYLRNEMGKAVDDFTPFDEAYEAVDWSAYEGMPAFEEAHRPNVYQVYLSLEQEGMQ